VAFVIENRPDLRRAFYRLLAISPNDDALTEHDSEIQETVHYFLQSGIWNAQYWLLTNTEVKRWLRPVGPILLSPDSNNPEAPVWVRDPVSNSLSITLPTDFIRLAGDAQDTALYLQQGGGNTSGGRVWGQQIDQRDKNRMRGNWFYLLNDELRLTPTANPPANLFFDYYYRHPLLTEDDDPLEFPVDVRPLIVAEAAVMALSEAWLPFEEPESESRILRNLDYWRRISSSRARQTRRPQQFRGRKNPYGTNWF